MKIFSKCSVVFSLLMFFFGNSNIYYGMNDNEDNDNDKDKNKDFNNYLKSTRARIIDYNYINLIDIDNKVKNKEIFKIKIDEFTKKRDTMYANKKLKEDIKELLEIDERIKVINKEIEDARKSKREVDKVVESGYGDFKINKDNIDHVCGKLQKEKEEITKRIEEEKKKNKEITFFKKYKEENKDNKKDDKEMYEKYIDWFNDLCLETNALNTQIIDRDKDISFYNQLFINSYLSFPNASFKVFSFLEGSYLDINNFESKLRQLSIFASIAFKSALFCIGGHNVYKTILGNLHVYTSNFPSFAKFTRLGISYKINKIIYCNIIGFNLYKCIYGILSNIFFYSRVNIEHLISNNKKVITEGRKKKILRNIRLLRYGFYVLNSLEVSVDFSLAKYYCISFDISSLVMLIIYNIITRDKNVNAWKIKNNKYEEHKNKIKSGQE